ncbi:MAG: efflux RND transporter periplasmic adaptor subunit [Deltaproteobacteria bacterium]|nr:efflux RND transporter periplasmic adaptor subunit [Deltaproteobacteria bacterium]
MKKTSSAIIALAVGFAVGGASIWLFSKPNVPSAPGQTKEAVVKERKIQFYRNPMNPEATSPTPMKDSMGMPYVPVYEDEGQTKDSPGVVRISPEKAQRIGVKSEQAARRELKRVIRTVGRVEPVENYVHIINSKISGWVEKLFVNRTDQMVASGEKLLDLYSPDLVSAQEEYLLAWRSFEQSKTSTHPEVKEGAKSLLNAASQRLKYWDISEDQIERLKTSGKITRTLTIKTPAHGSVTEKMVVEGQKIEAGETLFKIIDHSTVWVYGEIYEHELPYVKVGEAASLYPSYAAQDIYRGHIEHVYGHLGSIRYTPEGSTEIRTAKIRFELPNKTHKLKLGMYMNIEIPVTVAVNAVSVPDSALIDTGARRLVIIDRRDGSFEPRDVEAGARADGYYEIKSGVHAGEWVVSAANFLIDSESNLKAAIGGLGGHEGHGKAKKQEPIAAEKADKKEDAAPSEHKGH